MPHVTAGIVPPDRTARGQEARMRLLEAALTSFSSRGFHGTGTRDIAAGAGMSPAAVYVHYSSKEELLFQLSLAGHQHVKSVMDAATSLSSTPVDQLRDVVREFAAWHARFHTNARVVQYEMGSLNEEHAREIASIRRQIESQVRAIIDAGVNAGLFRVSNSAVTALAVASLGIDVARWYREDGDWSPEEIGEQYGELALRMVGHIPGN